MDGDRVSRRNIREERLAVTHLDVGDAGISVLAARE